MAEYKCVYCGKVSDKFYAPTDPKPNGGYTCDRQCFELWYNENYD